MNERVLYNKIRCLIQKKQSFRDICNCLGLTDSELMLIVERMKEYGICLAIKNGSFIKCEKPKSIEEEYHMDISKTHIRIGFLGDTHLASKYDDTETLNRIYNIAEDTSVDYMFHCGDFTDGVLGIPGFENYLKEDSYVGQVEYAIDKYPRYSGKTYAVSGNHDDYWTMLTSKEIISDIESSRSDIVYLGGNRRVVSINGLSIQIMHGDFNPITNDWFRERKYLNQITKKPHILHTGHRHTSYYNVFDDTHSVRTSSIMEEIIRPDGRFVKNDKSVYFADIYFDDDANPEKIDIKKLSFHK